jgi:hypothetical protein
MLFEYSVGRQCWKTALENSIRKQHWKIVLENCTCWKWHWKQHWKTA